MSNSLLDIRHLTLGADLRHRDASAQKHIVDDVSFSVAPGKVLGLIGESGAGKSSIGLAALGYCRQGVRVLNGQVLFDGQDLLRLPPAQRNRLRGSRIAYVAQSAASAFNPTFKLGEQVIESAVRHRVFSRKQALARAEQLFTLLGMPDPHQFLQRYPHQVSGGQLQRAMTAMALCAEPELIIFDEPTTALDVTTQIGVLLAIRKAIEASGVAALYISHDLAVVTQIADDILVLKDGKQVEYGTVAQIIDTPKQDYTRRLVGMRNQAGPAPGHDGETVLAARGLSMAYRGGRAVLSGISLALPAGETLALVGESGSGKSSLARVLCGLTTAQHGEILFRDRMLPPLVKHRRKEDLRRLQLVHQLPDIALNPSQKVEVIVGRPLTHFFGLRAEQRHRRVIELLRLVELDPALLGRYPDELSGGQKQRICIARALAARPEVIICDEPTSALDPLVAQGILSLLSRLQRETGVALLLITHDIHIVRTLAHSVAVMHQGKIIRMGKTAEVLSPPFDTATARLLGAVPEMEIGWLDRWARNNLDLTMKEEALARG